MRIDVSKHRTFAVARLVGIGLAAAIVFLPLHVGAQAVTQEELESFAAPHQRMSDDVKELMESRAGEIDLETMEQAESVVKRSRDPLEEGLREHFNFDPQNPSTEQSESKAEIVIYVSSSLPGSEIRDAILSLEQIEGVTGRIVYRGIQDGEKIGDFAKRARNIVGEMQVEQTNFELDPTRFRDSGVTAVPRMEYRNADGRLIVAVDGLSNPYWLLEQLEQGEQGELGTRGPVREVAERDLIEVMKERFLALDLESEKERTMATFWNRISLADLPAAQQSNTRHINPAIRIPEAITDAKGEVIHPAGTIINPLLVRDFTRRLLIINPTRQAERNWLKNRPEDDRKDIVMITDIDRNAGWDGYVALQDDIGHSAFLLTPDVRQRFQIRATPTQVTAGNGRFIVREYHMDEAIDRPNPLVPTGAKTKE